jgi:putative sigma-54 modulation protein
LTKFYSKIISADVVLKLEKTGKIQDKVAEIKISIPGAVLVAKDSSKVFEESVDNVVESLKRQLLKHKEKTMAAQKSHLTHKQVVSG